MAYYDVALLADDPDFSRRSAAAYSTELAAADILPVGNDDPMAWASTYSWALASAPGFADAYAYALANSNPAPGRDPTVITDGQILAAVQHILGADPVT